MKILVGMSGGLDSTSVALKLLQDGHGVTGAFIRFTDISNPSDARVAAKELGIELLEIDCREDFKKYVIDYFVTEYQSGRTPNPCVMCNRYAKINTLYNAVVKHGFDKYATGHYGIISFDPDRQLYYVTKSQNVGKDQSYVLWQLTQAQLSYLMLPLENTNKEHLRENARKLGLSAAITKESQDICFIPDSDYVKFIKEHSKVDAGFTSGDFVLPSGEIVGKHKGIINYTIGQRKGLGISYGQPLFITKIDPKTNIITVAPDGVQNRDTFVVSDLNFQYIDSPTEQVTKNLLVKTRYKAKEVPATVTFDREKAYVTLETPARAITPGQSAVFYDGDKVAFGGIIE